MGFLLRWEMNRNVVLFLVVILLLLKLVFLFLSFSSLFSPFSFSSLFLSFSLFSLFFLVFFLNDVFFPRPLSLLSLL